VILKREQTQEPYTNNGIRHVGFPFSSPHKKILDIVGANANCTDFEYDLCFMCGASYPERQRVADALRDGFGDRALVAISPDARGGLDLLQWEEYLRVMARSKIGVNVRGYGYDTVRFWETGTLSLLVADPLPLIYANPYNDRETIRKFTDHTNVVQVINELLENQDELLAMRSRCIQHTLTYHTNEARARFLVDLLKERGLIK